MGDHPETHVGNREATMTFFEERSVSDKLEELESLVEAEATFPNWSHFCHLHKHPFVIIVLLYHYITMSHHFAP